MSYSEVMTFGRQRARSVQFFFLGVIIVFGLLPALAASSWYMHIMIMVMLYATLSSAWNLLGGYCGQFSVGHAAFFGASGYTMGILMAQLNLNPFLAALVGVAVSGALAALVGWSCLRLTGIFFSLATFALAEILRKLALFQEKITGGPLGLTIAFPTQSKLSFYIFALALMICSFVVVFIVERSKFGYYCQAVRENEDAAKAAGISTNKVKVWAALISAALTGIGGAFYAAYIGVIEPDVVFGFNLSIKIIIVTIIGGAGTLIGPLLGAIIVVVPDEFIRGWLGGAYASWSGMIYGAMLVVIILVRPNGLGAFLHFIIPAKRD